MKRFWLPVAFLVAALFVAGCAPAITVQNNTSFPVRVVISTANGSEVVSPSPGESSSVEAAEGSYRATAIPDAEWIEYAKSVRKYLNDQLANSDQLTGPQLLDVVRRLKEIAAKMQEYEKAAGSTGSCSGAVSSDKDGLVDVTTNAGGVLALACK